jgi:hypothetical protein
VSDEATLRQIDLFGRLGNSVSRCELLAAAKGLTDFRKIRISPSEEINKLIMAIKRMNLWHDQIFVFLPIR